MEEGLKGKAELIHGGAVRLPEGLQLQGTYPQDGTMVFSFSGCRVKKSVSYEEGEFELHQSGRILSIWKDGSQIANGVKVLPTSFHCPDQAYFNLDPERDGRPCYYDSPVIPVSQSLISVEDIMERLSTAMSRGKVKSVAFTSGICGDAGSTAERMADCVAAVREAFPKMTIGAEAYITEPSQIGMLREAGINEIRINTGCARRDIFEKLCPDADYELPFEMLKACTDYFKRGKMASTFFYGLGETDQDVDMMLERLSRMNVLPVLRMARTNGRDRELYEKCGIPMEQPSVLRSMFLAGLQKNAMARHGLNPERFHSMCFTCQCCDLVPFYDF